MLKKMFKPTLGTLLSLFLLALPSTTLAQTAASCNQDYTVQAGDSLSKISSQFFGNGRAFPAIVTATNAAAQSGNYTSINDPNLIVPGWVLCIPNAAEGQMPMNTGTMTDSMGMMDEGMMNEAMMMDKAVLATANPGELANDKLVNLSPDLAQIQATFGDFSGITSIQSVKVGQDGTAYVTADMADSTGAILITTPLMNSNAMIGGGARMIAGPATGLMAPKGLEIVEELDLILVADFGAKDIKAFSTTASGDASPIFTVSNLGGERSLWDLDHDLASDTLFVAGTDGAYLVFDQFSANQGAAGPNRVVTPVNAMGNKISVNLHGIAYVPGPDILLLSDVGDANSATDGQLFTISNASTVANTTQVMAQIGGGNTRLGNPVDLDFDGAHLYVAEKSNDLILRYDNILETTGSVNAPADLAMAVTKAESVTLIQ